MVAVFVVLLEQIAGHLRMDLRVDETFRGADPFRVEWYVPSG
jgi:hypothetical protein